ncbi:MAG: hypothetical protein AMK69_03770 [Nitrospira bacterium SG8_3]|nr:MAG: hypothetical protein AMK69_03770 [Nitrospira bacterium SG8_3]
MKIYAVLFLSLLLLNTPVQGEELSRLALDDALSLGTTVSTDQKVSQDGNGSIKISTVWPTTICLGEVQRLNVENAQIIYRARVKSEKLEGTAFLEMWCHVGGGQYFSRGMNSVVSGTMDWRILQTPFLLKPGQRTKKVTLNIVINGKGTVWVDDVHLLKEPLK